MVVFGYRYSPLGVEWDLHEAYNRCDFDCRKYEFRFAVAFDAKEVDDDNHEEENRDKDGFAKAIIPVFYCQSAGNNLQRQGNEPL